MTRAFLCQADRQWPILEMKGKEAFNEWTSFEGILGIQNAGDLPAIGQDLLIESNHNQKRRFWRLLLDELTSFPNDHEKLCCHFKASTSLKKFEHESFDLFFHGKSPKVALRDLLGRIGCYEHDVVCRDGLSHPFLRRTARMGFNELLNGWWDQGLQWVERFQEKRPFLFLLEDAEAREAFLMKMSQENEIRLEERTPWPDDRPYVGRGEWSRKRSTEQLVFETDYVDLQAGNAVIWSEERMWVHAIEHTYEQVKTADCRPIDELTYRNRLTLVSEWPIECLRQIGSAVLEPATTCGHSDEARVSADGGTPFLFLWDEMDAMSSEDAIATATHVSAYGDPSARVGGTGFRHARYEGNLNLIVELGRHEFALLGSLSHLEQPNLVTSREKGAHIWKTKQQQSLFLMDGEGIGISNKRAQMLFLDEKRSSLTFENPYGDWHLHVAQKCCYQGITWDAVAGKDGAVYAAALSVQSPFIHHEVQRAGYHCTVHELHECVSEKVNLTGRQFQYIAGGPFQLRSGLLHLSSGCWIGESVSPWCIEVTGGVFHIVFGSKSFLKIDVDGSIEMHADEIGITADELISKGNVEKTRSIPTNGVLPNLTCLGSFEGPERIEAGMGAVERVQQLKALALEKARLFVC